MKTVSDWPASGSEFIIPGHHMAMCTHEARRSDFARAILVNHHLAADALLALVKVWQSFVIERSP